MHLNIILSLINEILIFLCKIFIHYGIIYDNFIVLHNIHCILVFENYSKNNTSFYNYIFLLLHISYIYVHIYLKILGKKLINFKYYNIIIIIYYKYIF